MAKHNTVSPDPWSSLRTLTRARIALGRSGSSLTTDEVLSFGYDHAMARDAVHRPFDAGHFCADLQSSGFNTLAVASAAPDRATYLLRPDLGRRLDDASRARLQDEGDKDCDLLLVVGDGLSSLAVSQHAQPLLEQLRPRLPASWRVGPVIVASQARVALSDEIGELMRAKVALILIGERPGLSSPDSLGIYITCQPKVGRQDADRNCISNIRPEGLTYAQAAHKALWLVDQAMRLGLSGVGLKDESEMTVVGTAEPPYLSVNREGIS